ncbi:MAG: ATP-binding protein, partial [Planctomycetota bacterium]
AFRIFDPFYTTRNDGLGLGLTISRSIIESHAGRLRLVQPTDDADRGSCFRFTLPLRAAPIEP